MERKKMLYKQSRQKWDARFRKKGTTGELTKKFQKGWKVATENIFSKPNQNPKSNETFMSDKNDTDFGVSDYRIVSRLTVKKQAKTKARKKEIFLYNKDGTKADDNPSKKIKNGKKVSYKTSGPWQTSTQESNETLAGRTTYEALPDDEIHTQSGTPGQKIAAGGIQTVTEQWVSPADWLGWKENVSLNKLSGVLISDWYENAKNTTITNNNHYGTSSSNSKI